MNIALNEAERQVLIALIELSEPITTPNNTHYAFYPKTLEEAASYFRSLREDWMPAYATLVHNGWIKADQNGYSLSETGQVLARQERLDHPPIWYWYREYYTITLTSQVYSRFCERLYGKDLCQTDFSDMAQIDFMIQQAGLKPGQNVLDLGCGRGLLAEYLSDCTGAHVWGVDYIPEAIDQAQVRTQLKRDRLTFQKGNFDHLDFENGMFDLVIAVDTLYMPNNLIATLNKLKDMLAPGGRMLIFYSSFAFDPTQPRDHLAPDGTDLARALQAAGFVYHTWDFTESQFHLMRRKHQLAEKMRRDFEREGTLFLYDHVIAESDSSADPYDPASVNITRYLYEIQV